MEASQESQLSFEELVQLDKDLSTVEFGTAQEAAGLDLQGKLKKICDIYKTIKSALKIILSIPFVPGSIKTAIKAFMGVMDTICV